MAKGITNANSVACKFGSASTRATNDRLEVIKEERRKREELMKRQKAEAMVAKQHRARGGINLSSEKKDKNDTGDNTDPNQADLD